MVVPSAERSGWNESKPPQSWDDRIRTFDVDGRWRGIALAPTIGDTYCLVTVLPQDKADAYATTRRFSTPFMLPVICRPLFRPAANFSAFSSNSSW